MNNGSEHRLTGRCRAAGLILLAVALMLSLAPGSFAQNSLRRSTAVQVGAFRGPAGAEELAAQLKEKGFDPTVIPAADYHRVVLGPFANDTDANAAIARLKGQGFDGYIRRDLSLQAASQPSASRAEPAPTRQPAPRPTPPPRTAPTPRPTAPPEPAVTPRAVVPPVQTAPPPEPAPTPQTAPEPEPEPPVTATAVLPEPAPVPRPGVEPEPPVPAAETPAPVEEPAPATTFPSVTQATEPEPAAPVPPEVPEPEPPTPEPTEVAAAASVSVPQSGVAPIGQVKSSRLKILVLEGQDAINNVKQRTSRDPVVQVVDENDRPVAGVAVTFALPSRGASGAFANGARSMTILTDSQGMATATGFTPNTVAGDLGIQVSASHQGQTASTLIAQSNVAAGAGMSAATIGIIGAIAAAAAVGAAVALGGGDDPVVNPPPPTPPVTGTATVRPGGVTIGVP